MAALRDVFDTNHDDKLDAGDAGSASFKLMVTNADGTTSVEAFTQAGITSIISCRRTPTSSRWTARSRRGRPPTRASRSSCR